MSMGHEPGPQEEQELGDRELKELVGALKDAIIDLRTAVSEITNPLNVMRRYGEMEEFQAIKQTAEGKQPLGQAVTAPPTPESASPEIVQSYPGAPQKSSHRGSKPSYMMEASPGTGFKVSAALKGETPFGTEGLRSFPSGFEEAQEQSVRRKSAPTLKSMSKILKLIKTMYMLRERLPSDLLGRYVELLSSLGVVPEDDSDVVKKLFEVIDEGVKKGLSIEDQLIILHILVRTLDVESEELEEEVLRILSNMVKKVNNNEREGEQ